MKDMKDIKDMKDMKDMKGKKNMKDMKGKKKMMAGGMPDKKMAYKKGGKVRGCGKATQGVRKAKMY